MDVVPDGALHEEKWFPQREVPHYTRRKVRCQDHFDHFYYFLDGYRRTSRVGLALVG